MHRFLLILVVCLLLPIPAGGQTLFTSRDRFSTIQAYREYLGEIRTDLYADDSSIRSSAFERLEDSLDDPPSSGDAIFPLELLGDLLVSFGLPPDTEPDWDAQEEALEILMNQALEEDYPLERREIALHQLERLFIAKDAPPESFLEDALDTVIQLVESEHLPLAHGALNALAGAATRAGKPWEEIAQSAGEQLAETLEADDPERRYLGWMTTLTALKGTQRTTSTMLTLWKALEEAAEDIELPAFHGLAASSLKDWVASGTDARFSEAADDLLAVLSEFDGKTLPTDVPWPEVPSELTEAQTPEELEEVLARLSVEARIDSARRSRAMSILAAQAMQPEIAPFPLRMLLHAYLALGRTEGSVLLYFRMAGSLLDLIQVHAASGKATVVFSQLARLLAASDHPGLLLPILAEIKVQTLSPTRSAWVGKRLVALLFFQAGNSPDASIRQAAFEHLREIERAGPGWAVRQEIWTRMMHLARFAHDEDIKSRASDWLET